jgi:hypothetical protein
MSEAAGGLIETIQGTLKTGLEFMPGTTDDSKKVVLRMFRPGDLLNAYRTAKKAFNSGDVVLAASDQAPGIQYAKRIEYVTKHLRRIFGKRAAEFRMWADSAQSVMKLPAESEAFWLIVELQKLDMPIMCVIYAVPYQVAAGAN